MNCACCMYIIGPRDSSINPHTSTQKQYGTPYAIVLENFPPNAQVNVELFRKQVRCPHTLS